MAQWKRRACPKMCKRGFLCPTQPSAQAFATLHFDIIIFSTNIFPHHVSLFLTSFRERTRNFCLLRGVSFPCTLLPSVQPGPSLFCSHLDTFSLHSLLEPACTRSTIHYMGLYAVFFG